MQLNLRLSLPAELRLYDSCARRLLPEVTGQVESAFGKAPFSQVPDLTTPIISFQCPIQLSFSENGPSVRLECSALLEQSRKETSGSTTERCSLCQNDL